MCWFSHMFIMTSWCGWTQLLWKSAWQPLDSIFGFHVALSCIPGQQCCSGQAGTGGMLHQGSSFLLGSFAVAAALLTGPAQVLWQLPCLECFSGVTAVVPQWWHSAPRVTYEGSVCEDWRSSVLALANNEFSSRQFLSSVHTCNYCKCSVGVLMTVMCSEQTCEYLTLILSAVNLVVFY